MRILSVFVFLFLTQLMQSQTPNNQLGAWYMYFYNHQFKESQWGIQGDVQYRNWNIAGDLEQLLLRSGVTYTPKNAEVKFTLGYAHITSGVSGSSNATSVESRIYQEALLPQKVGNRVYLNHRFRYEQRFVEDQDFRTRFRYTLFANIPLNASDFSDKTYYLALYNELFVNGETDIGNGAEVELFDRNRTYLGLGYMLNPKMRLQLGWMNQKVDAFGKGQLQVSLHHNF